MLITVAICFEVHTVFHCWYCGFESSYSMVGCVVVVWENVLLWTDLLS